MVFDHALRVYLKDVILVCNKGEQWKEKNALQDCAFYTEWGSWSQCSVSCGGGQRIQTRSCVNELDGVRGCDGPNSNTELCSFNVSKIKSNLDNAQGLLRRSVYRVAGLHLRHFEPGQHSSKKRHSGGKLLATLYPI